MPAIVVRSPAEGDPDHVVGLRLEPYAAKFSLTTGVPVLLNTNETPYPLPEPLVARIAERVAEAARGLNRYPDPAQGAVLAVAVRDELPRTPTQAVPVLRPA